MSYSQFINLEMIETNFGITIADKVGIFANLPKSEYSDLLSQTLQENISLALAINTEKARSELIVTPILVKLRKQFKYQISLFSGKEFNVDLEKGLTGFCDFLISRSPEQLLIKAPVVALVEAKNDDIQAGLPQCMAEMIAAQIFNERRNNNISEIYGVVTTGTNWKFLRLSNQIIEVDLNDYFIDNISQIIGILKYLINAANL
ncbi:MAG: hypothetical protein JGK03_23025 [Microcoleus sp. PH2017_25_DOB_D_A]|uniref:hypothetical protein n=2 Tax=unclassified Microcoleus TaxID=2642155 RepID=UPI001D50C62D|nr:MULTISPECIES: hypothetical protein [unclassified Microcoleus]MCC3536993.1 hypothetical protein [Microcoleus sp. PH2017_25_DOB_D_A]MCC3549325.1 hypothetical protein [Microcoleus sp. PH2017_24_DOB_U_A]TAE36519.1 MAG: hypothetical protein EAZ90_28350 [Oscillatoriales cyanobacterium]TAF97265.1 MAG: hypothetical protein EAZ45_22245 [Oscillatoriales cyanobacterium]